MDRTFEELIAQGQSAQQRLAALAEVAASVERMNEDPSLGFILFNSLKGICDTWLEFHCRAIASRRIQIILRSVIRHYDHGVHPEPRRNIRDSLRMISTADRDDASAAFIIIQL